MTNKTAPRKTVAMLRLEEEHGVEIRELILNELAKSRIDANVARQLGLHPSTLSYWIIRLDIEAEAASAREQRSAT